MKKIFRQPSNFVFVVGFILLSIGLALLLQTIRFGRTEEFTAILLFFAAGGVFLYMRFLKQAEGAIQLIRDKLGRHGAELPESSDPLGTARAAVERLERYESEISSTIVEAKKNHERRIEELTDAHQDLITHHKFTKRMFQSQSPEEVFDTLLRGVRDGFGFHGTVMAVCDANGDIIIREDLEDWGVVRIPGWDERSLLARTLWNGKHLMIGNIDEQKHLEEDGKVTGEGRAFLLPISRKQNRKCSDVRQCGNNRCPAYGIVNPRCWIEGMIACLPPDSEVSREEKRKMCIRCDMFAASAMLIVRSRQGSRDLTDENVIVITSLADEATLALEMVDLYEDLRRMSVTDGLTGLTNHREFYRLLRWELERARRYRNTVTVMIIDVDDFKRFNDRFGHRAGDFALKTVAELLRNCARGTDVVARYGGEEFGIILPESEPGGALMLAERIKTEVAQHNFLPQSKTNVNLTVSIGIYSSEGGKDTEDQIVSYADEAAYRAKDSGKNRVVVKTHA